MKSYKDTIVLNFQILSMNNQNLMIFFLQNNLSIFMALTNVVKIITSNDHKILMWIYAQTFFLILLITIL